MEVIDGLGCRFTKWKFPAAIVTDRRNKARKPRFVGIIRKNIFKKGYCMCPFVLRALEFDTYPPVPQVFTSAEKTWWWIRDHAVAWTDGKVGYRDEPFSWSRLIMRSIYTPLSDFRTRAIFLQAILSVLIFLYHPDDITLAMQIAKTVFAGMLGFGALIDIIIVIKRQQ